MNDEERKVLSDYYSQTVLAITAIVKAIKNQPNFDSTLFDIDIQDKISQLGDTYQLTQDLLQSVSQGLPDDLGE